VKSIVGEKFPPFFELRAEGEAYEALAAGWTCKMIGCCIMWPLTLGTSIYIAVFSALCI
jgi:hypothetical protein